MYKSKKPYLYGTGRRKSSVARVHLFPNGTGAITINGRDIDDYFGLETLKLIVRQPLDTTDITQIRPLLYVSEAMIREAVPRLQLPVVHNPCPADGHTKRQEVKTLIASLEPQYPKLKESIFAAMQRLPLPHWAPRELRRRPPTE